MAPRHTRMPCGSRTGILSTFSRRHAHLCSQSWRARFRAQRHRLSATPWSRSAQTPWCRTAARCRASRSIFPSSAMSSSCTRTLSWRPRHTRRRRSRQSRRATCGRPCLWQPRHRRQQARFRLPRLPLRLILRQLQARRHRQQQTTAPFILSRAAHSRRRPSAHRSAATARGPCMWPEPRHPLRRHHHHHHDQVSKKEKREKKEHGRHGSSKTYRDRVDNGDDEDAHDSRDDGDHQPGFSPPANFASGNSDEAADHHGEGGLGVVSATRSGKKDDERKKKKSSKESKEHRRAKKPVEPADDGEDMPDLDELKSRGVRRNKPAAASSIAVANAAAPPETVVVVAVADASAVADVVAAREVTDHKEEQDSGNAVTEAPVHASTAVSVEEVLPAVVVQQQQESHDEHLLPEAEDEKQDHSESFSTSATVSGTAEDNSNADGSRLVSVLDHDDPPLDEPAGELALE
eukprot:comp21804_c1_seq1/m.49030 comp21804_c1_seq1/g.49030  ORF comp21804_c1_seq1/g.49030 comp21804_c1_seq1/m.49030 type:complete len:462 (-) comp21804_c1_seq1:95-1480(-)